MLNFVFLIAAVGIEIASWTLAGSVTTSANASLLSFWALHAVASILLALGLLPLLRAQDTQPRWATLSLLACLSFVLPLLGFILVPLAVLTLRLYPSRPHAEDFSSLVLPEFDQHQDLQSSGHTAGMRSLLANRRASSQLRFKALVTLNHVKGRVASPMLRDVLNDPSDDLRLLAYGMLDRMEQKISLSIHEELQALKDNQSPSGVMNPRGLSAARHLSDLYWELLYQELAVDDMHDFAAQQSLHYCDLVLQQEKNDPPLILRRGRLLHALGKTQEAAQCYAQALALGMPPTQVQPYQAQIYFEARDFSQVRTLMHDLSLHNVLPKLRPVIDYWSPRNDATQSH